MLLIVPLLKKNLYCLSFPKCTLGTWKTERWVEKLAGHDIIHDSQKSYSGKNKLDVNTVQALKFLELNK